MPSRITLFILLFSVEVLAGNTSSYICKGENHYCDSADEAAAIALMNKMNEMYDCGLNAHSKALNKSYRDHYTFLSPRCMVIPKKSKNIVCNYGLEAKAFTNDYDICVPVAKETSQTSSKKETAKQVNGKASTKGEQKK